MYRRFLFGTLALLLGAQSKDITGTWIANRTGPMGDMEIVYELKVVNGKITGAQKMPFGDSPIVDGQFDGDDFELVVETESFGSIQKRVVKGKIVGDTLEITPAMPGPPPGAAPPDGGPPGGMRAMTSGPLIAHRGTPTLTYRAPSLDYKTLPKVELPALRDIPSNGLAKTPPMGWNSWNKFRTRFDDKTVREIADAMVSSGMKDAGYVYINIDDGWQSKRDEKGVLQPNPNFPDMKALADYVHSKGLKLGIYSSPGPRTCAGYQGSYGHEEIDAQTWAAWGIDYLKYDWCSASRVWKDTDMQALYQRMGEALQKAGRPIVYSLCQYGRSNVQEWGPKVAGNSWRTTGDILDQWVSMERIGFSQSDFASYAAPGHWNDPDMLEVGNGGMTDTEYRTHFSLWSLLAAPLLAGNDIRAMTPETRAILTNRDVIAVNQDRLGKAASRIAADGSAEVWARPLDKGAWAVGLFNRGPSEAGVTVKWADLKLKGKLKMRDLWEHHDLQSLGDSYTANVPSHGVVMLRVTK